MAVRNFESDLRDFSDTSLSAALRVEAVWRAAGAVGGLVVDPVLDVGSGADEPAEVLRACGRVLGWLLETGKWELNEFAVRDFVAYDHLLAYSLGDLSTDHTD